MMKDHAERQARLGRDPQNPAEWITISQSPSVTTPLVPMQIGVVLEWRNDDTKASLTKRFRELLQFCHGLEEGE